MYIEINNVSKKLKKNIVLQNINIKLEQGKIYGIVGKNGCGKTMLLRAIAGLLKPDTGEVIVNGINIYKNKPNHTTGVIIENVDLFSNLSAFNNLKLLNGFNKNPVSDKKIIEVLEQIGLDPYSKKVYKNFSLGMKQKLCIAQALIPEPDILILDEPTNALDAESVKCFNKIVLEKDPNTTVIIASHLADEINSVCEKIINMENGKII